MEFLSWIFRKKVYCPLTSQTVEGNGTALWVLPYGVGTDGYTVRETAVILPDETRVDTTEANSYGGASTVDEETGEITFVCLPSAPFFPRCKTLHAATPISQ